VNNILFGNNLLSIAIERDISDGTPFMRLIAISTDLLIQAFNTSFPTRRPRTAAACFATDIYVYRAIHHTFECIRVIFMEGMEARARSEKRRAKLAGNNTQMSNKNIHE